MGLIGKVTTDQIANLATSLCFYSHNCVKHYTIVLHQHGYGMGHGISSILVHELAT